MQPQFIFVVCQNGAEAVCKKEVLRHHAELKFAFSRPGFITFKCEQGNLPEKFILKSTFARTYGWSIGNHKSAAITDHIEKLLDQPHLQSADHLHVWQRDLKIPGASGFEPGQSVLAEQVGKRIDSAFEAAAQRSLPVNRHAKANDLVFDVVLIEPDYWFTGFHHAQSKIQRWPGGTPRLTFEDTPISRAYFKLKEALLWSGIHIKSDDVCAEIGSSPGGACQLLLEKGAKVLAVDPAELDESIANHENLKHLRCRGKEIRKKELKDVKWLLSDINVAPRYTLDMIKEILGNQHVNKIKGLILTLKLSDLELAEEIPNWTATVKNLGFQIVRTRQLAFNRREICLIAARDKFVLRSSKKR